MLIQVRVISIPEPLKFDVEPTATFGHLQKLLFAKLTKLSRLRCLEQQRKQQEQQSPQQQQQSEKPEHFAIRIEGENSDDQEDEEDEAEELLLDDDSDVDVPVSCKLIGHGTHLDLATRICDSPIAHEHTIHAVSIKYVKLKELRATLPPQQQQQQRQGSQNEASNSDSSTSSWIPSQLRGLDRLVSLGFSNEEVSSMRAGFLQNYRGPAAEARAAEDRLVDEVTNPQPQSQPRAPATRYTVGEDGEAYGTAMRLSDGGDATTTTQQQQAPLPMQNEGTFHQELFGVVLGFFLGLLTLPLIGTNSGFPVKLRVGVSCGIAFNILFAVQMMFGDSGLTTAP